MSTSTLVCCKKDEGSYKVRLRRGGVKERGGAIPGKLKHIAAESSMWQAPDNVSWI